MGRDQDRHRAGHLVINNTSRHNRINFRAHRVVLYDGAGDWQQISTMGTGITFFPVSRAACRDVGQRFNNKS